MRKRFLIFCYIFFNLALLSKNIDVCQNCKYKSIKEALQSSSKGDLIFVKSGLYKEGKIVVDKEVSILGDNSIVDGLKQEHVFDVRANNVRIENLIIRHSGVSDRQEFAGIYGEDIQGCRFLGNTLESNTYGIYLAHAKNCLVKSNTLYGNAQDEVLGGNGIHLWYSGFIKIFDNTIQNHRDGLYFEFSSDIEIKDNISSNCMRYGMHFMFSHRNEFINNQFIRNPTGVAVMYSKNIKIIGNKFQDSNGLSSYGILLKDITDSMFSRNLFYNNTIGIYSDNSLRNTFRKNTIQKNGWAVHLLGNSDGNVFQENNFIDNIFDVSTNSRRNPNKFKNNYWSKYQGFDLDKDGQGDVPYRPVQLYSYLIQFYPVLLVLLKSPSIEILELAEKAFPIITPVKLVDENPNIKKFRFL